MNAAPSQAVGFTLLTKIGGPLTKHITLAPDGTLQSHGSACVMAGFRNARSIKFAGFC
jgi:hypothetical protein